MNNSSNDHLLDDEWLDELDFSSLVELPKLKDSKTHPQFGGDKYIIFHLDDKIYGINSKSVAEVASSLPVTPLPGVPEWVSGIANLRGDLISIIDLRKLWKKNTQTPLKTRMIVFHSAKNDSPIAFIVDKLNEIVTLSDKEINLSAADFIDSFPTFFGKADFNSQPLFLLDIDKILSSLNIKDSKQI
jgi:purine-binding chemotaxis protein CheW